jgi:hypothetical protein
MEYYYKIDLIFYSSQLIILFALWIIDKIIFDSLFLAIFLVAIYSYCYQFLSVYIF